MNLSNFDILGTTLYTNSSIKVVPIYIVGYFKNEYYYLCKMPDNSYYEFKHSDLSYYTECDKNYENTVNKHFKPITVEEHGISRTYQNTKHFIKGEGNNKKIKTGDLRRMCDPDGLNSNSWNPDYDKIRIWNMHNAEYKIYVNPITFE